MSSPPGRPVGSPPNVDPDVLPDVHPLDDFYGRACRPLPRVEFLAPDQLPEPARALLVHQEAMTRRLEAAYGEPVALRVLDRRRERDVYLRHIVLYTGRTQVPVEFGSISLDLTAFSSSVGEAILSESAPVGRILAERGVEYQSRPHHFFRLGADALLAGALCVGDGDVLHGRCNVLIAPDRRVLARVVEILPPVRQAPAA